MNKAYNPKEYEAGISQEWENAKAFLAKMKNESKTGKSFTVPIPPPNVTGQLHLGHAMMLVIQDIMTRYHRMKGDSTLWLPGTDHAAIATESVVLKNLGVASREEFSRKEFMKKCFDHTKKTHATITNQVKKMGASCDFTRERYTMDLGLSNAVWKIFKDLYDQNLIVRGHRMVNWSTGAGSVLADDELEYEDQKDTFCYIKCGRFVMGTVRAETKCANSPLVLHPDEKYVVAKFTPSTVAEPVEAKPVSEEYIFSEVLFDDIERRTKIFNQLDENGKWEKISVHQGKEFEGEKFEAETYSGKRNFFVLCDEEVIDINKGTGAMTISVQHAADDYLLAKKYPDLLQDYYIEKIGFDGKMTAVAGELEGCEVKVARKRAIKIMLEKNLIVGLEKDYVHNVPLCYRTGCVVEPMISPQWFIDVNKKFDWVEGEGAVLGNRSLSLSKGEMGSAASTGSASDNKNKKNFIFLRHGESEDNVKKILQRENAPLTEKGIAQAEENADFLLKNKNITKIISSPTLRALQTAEIIAKKLELSVEIIDEFAAYKTNACAGTKLSEVLPLTPLEYCEKNGGEMGNDFMSRTQQSVEILKKLQQEDGDILVVSHRSNISYMEAILDGKTKEEAIEMRRKKNKCSHGVLAERKIEIQTHENSIEKYINNISTLHQIKPEKNKYYSQEKKYTIGKVSNNIKNILEVENNEIVISEFIYAKIRGWIPHLSGHQEISQSDFYFLPLLFQFKLEIYTDEKTQYRYMVLPALKKNRTFLLVIDGKKDNAEIVSFFYTNQKIKYITRNTRFKKIQKMESLEGPASVPSCITSNLRKDLKRLVAGEDKSSFASRQTLICKNIIKFFKENQLIFSKKVDNSNSNPTIEQKSLKDLTLEAITAHGGEINLIPDRFTKIYDQWIENLQDWCISRQIWWGHQIPIWYDKNGKQYVAQEQKLLFVRHGESEDNAKDYIGGDSSLTKKGKEQAEKLAKEILIEKRKIGKIYCSSLKRSKETAEIIVRTLSKVEGHETLQIEEIPELHEVFTGDLENTPRDICKKYPKGMSSMHKMLDLKTGETMQEIETRAKKIWEIISQKGACNGDILIVGHQTFLSQIFGVKDGRTADNLLAYRDRWNSMKNGEIREVLWMMKPKIQQTQQVKEALEIKNYSEYLKNIENLLQTKKKEKLYDKNKFYTIGKLSSEIVSALEIESDSVKISEFIYAKIKNWIPALQGHEEIDNADFYFLPYFLKSVTEIYENKATKERYLITHSESIKKDFVIVLDTKKEQNEIVTFFFTNHLSRYINNLKKKRYTKKRSLEGPANVPSCITSNLRKDLKRLVAGEEIKNTSSGFASRQTPMYKNINKFFENLQAQNNSVSLRQDNDTLDTWFSSALWPFSTLGWPDTTPDFENFFPTSVLETGHDILFFWVARMIMFSRFSTGKNPFSDVYLHGLVCDEHGKKMSKSKGNGIDPLEMIEKFGTDAVRMALVVGTTPGNQVNLGEKKIEGFRNFANKLWNISRYIFALEKTDEKYDIKNISLTEQWILSKTQTLISEVSKGIENHKYGEVGQKLYDFTWNDLADWAIESAKAEKSTTIGTTLFSVLKIVVQLLHSYMPFITEVLWKEMQKNKNSSDKNILLALSDFPIINDELINKNAEKQFEIVQNVTAKIRSLRSASKVDPVKKITAILSGNNREFLQENKNIIISLARLENLEFGSEPTDECVKDISDGTEIFLPLAGMLDMEKEAKRKEKELELAKKMLKNLEGRMANKKYMDNAPEHLVQQTKEQYADIKEKIRVLEK